MAQIMTKLPKDLKERVTGKHKLQIFQKLSQSIKIDNKLLEQFASVDPTLSLNTPVSMELDKGDYNTLNKKYLYELQNYEASKGYISAESMEYANYAKENITNNNTNNNDLKAQYVDNSPDFMLGQNDNTLYYFDSSSGTLTEMPLDSKQTPVSLKDLKTVLLSDKVKLGDIQNLITDLQIPPPALPTILSSDPTMTTQPATFFDTIGSFFTSGSRFQATGTSTPTAAPIPIATTDIPIPPQYMVNLFKDDKELGEYWRRGHHGHRGRHRRQENNLERRFEAREKLYEPVDDPIDKKHSSGSTKSFMNRTNANDIYPNKKRAEGFTNMNEEIFLKKIKNDNQQIENVALSFVTILILVFLLVIFNSLRK